MLKIFKECLNIKGCLKIEECLNVQRIFKNSKKVWIFRECSLSKSEHLKDVYILRMFKDSKNV